MGGSTLLMMGLVMLGGLSIPMLCWYIARRKGRRGRNWFTGACAATFLLPACGGLISLIVAALVPKAGEPISGEHDKTILYCGLGCLLAGFAGFAMLVPSIMTIVNAIK